jgi:hypothetical protein
MWIIVASVMAALGIGALGATVVLRNGDSEPKAAPITVPPMVSVLEPAITVPTTAETSSSSSTASTDNALPTIPPTMPPATTPQTMPPAPTTPSVVMPNPLVFPYDFYNVPELGPEVGVQGSGCDVEMLDGLWHGYITAVTAELLSVDRVCALFSYTACYGPASNVCDLVIENKKSFTRDFPLSAGFSVYKANWNYDGSSCSEFSPSALQSDYAEAVWIQITGGQVQWVLRPCG